MVSIQFLGAAGTVTGSKHLLKTPDKNILIDCGLFQGIKLLRQKNWEPLPVDPREVDLVILTHAHLDHCGYLPLFVKNGYKGEILMTAPTRDLTEIILLDSAEIQEEDAEKINRIGYSKHKPAKPLYTRKDAEFAIRQFEVVEIDQWKNISNEIRFRFIRNGHILGSAFIEMDCHGTKILFSGDIGRSNSELMYPPTIIPDCDVLIMESTYGDRLHSAIPAKDQLADIINDCIRKKGNVLIPSFAVGRAQELMHLINELKKEIRIPDIPVFMDSPMGASATNVLVKYQGWHKLTPQQCHEITHNIRIITDYRETKKTIDNSHIKIVIAASGMLTGGRVLEYLSHYLGDVRNTILQVGFQAEGTRGRALQDGAHELKLFGKNFPVRAEIKEITSLSAHADQQEMMNWLKSFSGKPDIMFLVHGESSARKVFSAKIFEELKIEPKLPMQNEEFTIR